MKVVFIKNVKSVGVVGQVKEVSDGYAQNFLFPQGLAKPATKKAVETAQIQPRRTEKKHKQYKQWSQSLAAKKIKFAVKTDEHGTLFAAVSPSMVSKELKKLGYDVQTKYISVPQPIKVLGKTKVHIKLPAQKPIQLTIHVTQK